MKEIQPQTEGQENTEIDECIGRNVREPPVSSQSAYSTLPTKREGPKEQSYFYKAIEASRDYMFDTVYKKPLYFDPKLHRDDREHSKHKGLDIHGQEIARPVAVLSSSEYGRHLAFKTDNMGRDHVRIALVKKEFFRKNGISKSVAEGYGFILPS